MLPRHHLQDSAGVQNRDASSSFRGRHSRLASYGDDGAAVRFLGQRRLRPEKGRWLMTCALEHTAQHSWHHQQLGKRAPPPGWRREDSKEACACCPGGCVAQTADSHVSSARSPPGDSAAPRRRPARPQGRHLMKSPSRCGRGSGGPLSHGTWTMLAGSRALSFDNRTASSRGFVLVTFHLHVSAALGGKRISWGHSLPGTVGRQGTARTGAGDPSCGAGPSALSPPGDPPPAVRPDATFSAAVLIPARGSQDPRRQSWGQGGGCWVTGRPLRHPRGVLLAGGNAVVSLSLETKFIL